jgi:putative ABC transport system substrate-binding protein
MERRTFMAVVSGGLLAAPLAATAQQTGKVYRIGYLSGGSSTLTHLIDAFRQGLRELGWVEGQNIVIDYRFAEGRYDRLPDLAAELVRLKVDVIVASPSPPAAAAKNATGTIPIVMIGAGADPVGQGLITSLARPGGNVTGLSYSVGQEIFGKQLALLKEAVPNVRRVAVLWNPAVPGLAPAIKDVKVAARSLGVQIQVLEARGPDDFDSAFAAMAKERPGALLVLVDSMFSFHGTRLARLAAKNRLPAAYTNRLPVEVGGLMSYGPSFSDLWRRAAGYVDKILKGAKPADLPVEQPTKFELVINLKTAKALGLTIPPALLARADEIIQ